MAVEPYRTETSVNQTQKERDIYSVHNVMRHITSVEFLNFKIIEFLKNKRTHHKVVVISQ